MSLWCKVKKFTPFYRTQTIITMIKAAAHCSSNLLHFAYILYLLPAFYLTRNCTVSVYYCCTQLFTQQLALHYKPWISVNEIEWNCTINVLQEQITQFSYRYYIINAVVREDFFPPPLFSFLCCLNNWPYGWSSSTRTIKKLLLLLLLLLLLQAAQNNYLLITIFFHVPAVKAKVT